MGKAELEEKIVQLEAKIKCLMADLDYANAAEEEARAQIESARGVLQERLDQIYEAIEYALAAMKGRCIKHARVALERLEREAHAICDDKRQW